VIRGLKVRATLAAELLNAGFDPEAHRRLVRTHWWRTLAWTARGGGLLFGVP